MNSVKKTIYMMLLTVLGMVKGVQAQVSITSVGQTYSQNFNSLPSSGTTTWSNNSNLSSWYADRSSGSGAISFYSDSGVSASDGLYSYGSDASDRALGALPGNPGVGNLSLGLRIKNNSSSTITALTITYSAEQWRANGSGSQTIGFSYKTSTSAITSVAGSGFTNVTSLNFSSPVTGSIGAIDGNSASNKETKSFTITGISLAAGSEIMLKWYFPKLANVDHGYAIDDLSITTGNPSVYYSKSTGFLNATATWGTNTDGTGTSPSNFQGNNSMYIIANNTAPTLNSNWDVQGTSSKIVLGIGNSINFTIPAAYTVTGTIDLASNSTLTINSEAIPTIGSRASSSSIIFNNSNPQTIPAGTYNNLTISGGGARTIAGSIIVTGTLNFTSGKLQLGAYDLIVSSSGSISGANSSNYVVTNGTGGVSMQVPNSATNISYPVGTLTNYNPVVLSQTVAGTTDNFKVRVFSGVSSSYNTSDSATGSSITSDVVTKTWAISESTAGGSNLSITLQWNASDEGTSFSRSACYVAHYTGGTWQSATAAAASGTGPYTRQLTGVTSFSPFTIADNSSPLPVRMLSFSGKPVDAGNELEWVTASELNNKGFEIERRDELSGEFVFIGFVNGHGTTSMVNNYIYNDDVTVSAFYRLKQVDFNDNFEYSQIIYVDRSNVNSTYSNGNVSIYIYPNPAVNSVSIEVAENSDWELNVKLVNIEGKEVRVPVKAKSDDGRKIILDVSAVTKGVLFYRICEWAKKLSQKLLIL